MASPCRQGATFSPAVVFPDVESSGIVRVPGVMSLAQCVAACCDLPGYDLAWLFEGRCYVLRCQQGANCRPRERPDTDSLVLPSLVRAEPFGGRWRPPSQSFEVPESLKGLARQDRPGTPLQGHPEGRQEETSRSGQTDQPSATGLDEERPAQGLTGSDLSSVPLLNTSQRAEGGSRSPVEPDTPTHVREERMWPLTYRT